MKILNMSIQGSIVVLVVLALRLLFKKSPKWITVLLWAVVAVRLICPISFESKASLMPDIQTISGKIVAIDKEAAKDNVAVQTNGDMPVTNDKEPSVDGEVVEQTFSIAPARTVTNKDEAKLYALDIVWLAGIAAMLGYAVVSYLRVYKRVKTAVCLQDNVYRCETVNSPFVLGIIRPKIYLSFDINEKSAQYVIAHERAHISRLDHILKPFAFLVLALHWFNPLVWLGFMLFRKDIELACDEKVIKTLSTQERADYSEALLKLSTNRFAVAACPLAFGEVGVKTRIKGVLSYKKPTFWVVVAALLVIAATGVCLLTNPVSDNPDKTVTDGGAEKKSLQLLSTLCGETPFIDAYGNSVYLSDYKPIVVDDTYSLNFEDVFTPDEYTFVDLDADGNSELVAYGSSNIDNLYLILREQDNKVYGYSLYYNMQLKADGTARTYHGSYVQHYMTISFDKTDYTENVFAEYIVYKNGDLGLINSSIMDGKDVSYEEIEAFVSEWEARPDAKWENCSSIYND